ncbi:MAG: hypothetical protein GY697_20505, partial [Desulfobacterales bacterium]|nr:hypothetical protein [Desulfobacterales bacterium]
GSRYGIQIYHYNYADGIFNIDNNEIFDNTHGIYVYNYINCTTSGTINNNNIYDNSGRGIYIWGRNNGYSRPWINYEISGNDVYWTSGHAAEQDHHGIYVYNEYSRINTQINNNEIYGADRGIYADNNGSSNSHRLTALISGNNVHDNKNQGIFCDETNRGTLTTEIRGNQVIDNGSHGIQVAENSSYATFK